MLVLIFFEIVFLAEGENLNETRMEISYVDAWPGGDWLPEMGNEISQAADVNELGERLRKSVDLLKKNPKMDLIFLIDSSSSIGEENFRSEMKFVQKLLADFKVGPFDARVAVIAFSSLPKTHVNHFEQEIYEKCSFLHMELPRMEYTGGNTNTIGALIEARKIFSKGRDDGEKALFLVTDGFSNKGDPVPSAEELKNSGIIIFTFGIQTGNVREVLDIASTPKENYSFILESFEEFEALARRALHQDLRSGSYIPVNDTRLCDSLCPEENSSSETGCCNSQSRCSCGILTGHFSCLCPPGFYGSGLVGETCLPCPTGTYHDGSVPGDILVCSECPDSNHITKVPAISENDCVCKEGFVAVDGKCEVITCPVLTVPTNGYFVKKNCSNVLNAACGVRCNTGYKLRGSSVRLCQMNGTWSGNPPKCVPKECKKPKPIRDGNVTCKNEDHRLTNLIRYDSKGNEMENSVFRLDVIGNESWSEDFNYTVDTVCAFQCLPGYTMRGSKTRTCLPILQWNGVSTTCSVVNCHSLSVLKDGIIKPEKCVLQGIRHDFATECFISCRAGYRLEGPSVRNCTGRRGTWTGKNVPNKCIDVEPPIFRCPENITVDAAEEESYALVYLTLPEGSDNSGLEPIIWSKPPFLPEYPLPMKIGTTKVEVYATDASDNGDFCEFYIQVQDKENPKVFNCESPPTIYMSDQDGGDLNWTEPIFTDNSDTPLKIERSHDIGSISLGTTSVVYVATDASGNSANCTLNITVAENPCADRPSLSNVEWNCTTESTMTNCSLSCLPGLTWTTNNDITNTTFQCQYDRNGAKWSPDIFSDLDALPECSVFEYPTEVVESHEIELDGKDVLCDDLERLSQDISNEINILIGSDDATKISITADCEDGVTVNPLEERNDIPGRRKRNERRRKIKVRVSLIGKTTNKTSNDDITKHLEELGHKVEEEYQKNSFLNVGGQKVKIEKTKTLSKAKLRCNAGFALRRGLCVKCPPGTFHDLTKSSCTPCPIGKFQNLEGQSQCESCPVGYLTRRRRRKQLKDCKRICPPGTFGTIKNKQQTLTVTPCTPCPVGSYQPQSGQKTCLECPEDQTTRKKGSSHAEQCIDKLGLDDPCHKFNCKNNGTCFVYDGYPYCSCPVGYFGSFCERERNLCDSSPCYNNGKCTPVGVTSFICTCLKGYEGDLCQFEVNECASNPCANGGECIDVLNGYKCECLSGFAGYNCEEDINECEMFNNPCQNNGTCNDLINEYSCTCREGFSGKHCEEISECVPDDIVDKNCSVVAEKAEEDTPCSGVSCPDNMQCTVTAGNRNLPLCKCRKGFYGRTCEEEINFNVILTFPQRSVTEYLTADFPPGDVHQISVCVWMQTSDNFNYGTLFSYAVKDVDNAFTTTDYNGFVIYVRGERVVTDIKANDGFWHFICITWESREGRWHIYLDGKLKGNGTGLSTNEPIPGGGRFIIGQEQDRFGGGFNEVESLVGKITHFDVWQRVLHKTEIQDMNENCKYFEGNLFSWVQFLQNINGNIEITKSTFCSNCKVRGLTVYKGKVSVQNVGESIFAVYECDTGFRIRFDEGVGAKETSTWYRKCLKHGNWEPLVPKCGRVACGFPGYFSHGTISGNSYLFTDEIRYKCNPGYTLIGNETRVCQENGSWSGDQPTCKGNSGYCEQILAPLHGSMFIYFGGRRKSHSSAIGDQAEFICDDGYRLRGSDTLTCTMEGLWDQQVPTCEEISCDLPQEIQPFVVNFTSTEGYAAGETLTIKCSANEESHIIECLQDGSWNYSRGLCGRRCEGGPSYPEHGLLLGDPSRVDYEPGETVNVKCRYGYKLLGDNFFTCSRNGTWHQGNKSICRPAECSKPIPPPNAYSSSLFDAFPYGRRISFKCSYGYKQLGDLQTRCDGEGQWTKIFGRCIEVLCRVPQVSQDVKITDILYFPGDKMKFECLHGKTKKTSDVVCQGDGKWWEMPRCL